MKFISHKINSRVHSQGCTTTIYPKFPNIFIISTGNFVTNTQFFAMSHPPQPLETTSIFPVSVDLPTTGISYKQSLCVWLLSLRVMLMSFMHIVICMDISFNLMI